MVSETAVRNQLERTVSSNVFAHSPRMCRFLRFIVEQELGGKGGELNEYLVGVAVFDRGEKFDPRIDSVVRADAVRLRAKVREYYESDGKNDPVRFGIPKGSYRPVFSANSAGNVPAIAAMGAPTAYATALKRRVRSRLWMFLLTGVALLTLLLGLYSVSHRPLRLTAKDTVLVADFKNTTGDPVFDGTLQQGLIAELEQSPFLNIVSERRVQEALRYMGAPAGARVRDELAWQVCQRTGSTVVVDGSVATLGRQYVLSLTALNCRTTQALASEQITAEDKEHVLSTMGKAASKLRAKLGESLESIERFDTPVEDATTPSLEALQAFSEGRAAATKRVDAPSAAVFFQRAIDLDPNFAMAYAALGNSLYLVGEPTRAAEALKKAYDLRERVSEREKFYISSHYYQYASGNLEKAAQAYTVWSQTYPQDSVPVATLAYIHGGFGQHEKALSEYENALRLEPGSAVNYANLVAAYTHLDRFGQAHATAAEALKKNLDSPDLEFGLYLLALLENDTVAMGQHAQSQLGRPGIEDMMLAVQADSAAYFGEYTKAGQFTNHAVISAQQAGERETAAGYEADAALRAALVGNRIESRRLAQATLSLSVGKDAQAAAALAFALSGEDHRADALATKLELSFPEDTVVKSIYLPTIRAEIELSRQNFGEAIRILEAVEPYEYGSPVQAVLSLSLYPAYIRGLSYLASRQPSKGAAEFQKIIDHQGVVGFELIGPLAHVGLARARAMAGDAAGARSEYERFFALWKNADANLPILRQSKSELSQLQ